MFRNLNEDDDAGFDNKGLEIADEGGDVRSSRRRLDGVPSTKIQITRSQYDQKQLNEEMMFKQPQSKSGEFLSNICLTRTRSEHSKIKDSSLNLSCVRSRVWPRVICVYRHAILFIAFLLALSLLIHWFFSLFDRWIQFWDRNGRNAPAKRLSLVSSEPFRLFPGCTPTRKTISSAMSFRVALWRLCTYPKAWVTLFSGKNEWCFWLIQHKWFIDQQKSPACRWHLYGFLSCPHVRPFWNIATQLYGYEGRNFPLIALWLMMNKLLSGTFAVVSIMVGKCVNKYSNLDAVVSNSTVNHSSDAVTGHSYSPIEIATLVCFMVGVIQVKCFQGNFHCKANLELLYSFWCTSFVSACCHFCYLNV